MHGLLHVREDGTSCIGGECDLLREVQTGATHCGVEENFRCRNGQIVPVSVSVSAIIKEQKAEGIVIAFHDITERKKFELELERLAQIDVLTGLNNRRHFHELAEQEMMRARRYGKSLAIMMLDVDHFKRINDNLGTSCRRHGPAKTERCLPSDDARDRHRRPPGHWFIHACAAK